MNKWLLCSISIVAIAFFSVIIVLFMKSSTPTESQALQNMSYYSNNITKITEENENFRQVLFTGPKSQLVVMNIPPGADIGAETHKYTEQTLFFLSGTGEGELNGKKFLIGPGSVVVVTAGTEHNFRNTGATPLKIYTVYAPQNHIDGRVHRTKAEAEADQEDESFGELNSAQIGLSVRLKIPKINVDSTIEYVGLDKDGAMDVPKGPDVVAWFNLGPRPGENGSAVIAGHFGWKENLPAVFDELHTLVKGDKIYVEDKNGVSTTFIVRESREFNPESDSKEVFSSDDGKSHLNLITCKGVWNQTEKSYSNRLVVFTDKEI